MLVHVNKNQYQVAIAHRYTTIVIYIRPYEPTHSFLTEFLLDFFYGSIRYRPYMHSTMRNSITIEIAAIVEGMACHVHHFAGLHQSWQPIDTGNRLTRQHFNITIVFWHLVGAEILCIGSIAFANESESEFPVTPAQIKLLSPGFTFGKLFINNVPAVHVSQAVVCVLCKSIFLIFKNPYIP